MVKPKPSTFDFVRQYRRHNDALELRQKRDSFRVERSVSDLNEQMRQWRLKVAKRLGLKP